MRNNARVNWLLGILIWASSISVVLGVDLSNPANPAGKVAREPVSTSGLLEYLQTQLVTLDLKDAELDNVLRLLSAQYEVNIVAGQAVTGKVTVSFKDATLAGALNSILLANGYGYIVEGNILRVAKIAEINEEQKQRATKLELEDLVTEVFFLNYLDATDVKKVLEPVLSPRGKITVVLRRGFKGFQFGQVAKLGGSGGTGSGPGSTGTTVGSLSTTTGTSTGSTGAAPGAIGLSKSGEGGEKSTIILVQDVPASVALIRAVLKEIDRKPKQILIQSRMFEVNADDLRDFGVDFSTGSSGLTSTSTPPVTGVPLEKHNMGPPPEQNQAVRTLLQGGGIARFIDPSGSFQFGRDGQDGLQLRMQKLTGAQFDALLRALESNVDFNELSGPRIMVLENQEAAILVGEQFPIFQVQAPNLAQNSTVESLSYFQPVGISLQVIPQIVGQDNINMVIHPSVSAITSMVTGSTGLTAPRISIREADTQVLIGNKETLVIGGLLQDKSKETVVGIPFAMDVPILGNFFKRKKLEVTKIELIIFITPSIVIEPEFTEREEILFEKTSGKEEIPSSDPFEIIRRKLKKQFLE